MCTFGPNVRFAWRAALIAWGVVALVVGLRLVWKFQGDVLGLYRIGSVRPHSPYVKVPPRVQAWGEVGYDGQLYLAIAMDPALRHPGSRAALDNPRFRYRRILFPLLGYVLALGWRPLVPWALVALNIAAMGVLAGVVGGFLQAEGRRELEGLWALGVPGYWCALNLTAADLLAAVGWVGALAALRNRRYGAAAAAYALGALAHETMLLAIGAMVLPWMWKRRLRETGIVLAGALPAVAWNLWVYWYLPPAGELVGHP